MRAMLAISLASLQVLMTGCGADEGERDDLWGTGGDGDEGTRSTEGTASRQGTGGSSGHGYEAVYDQAALPTFELTLPDDCVAALAATPNEYCAGEVLYRSGTGAAGADPVVSLANVGIRLKGSASFRPINEKASFKIKVDEWVEGQRLVGLRRITLNNMAQDPSMLHERLGYQFYRSANVPAPLANHARVYVNGEYYGLYANVQTLDDEFAEKLWEPAPGNLYDVPSGEYFYDLLPEYLERFELETNSETANRSDLEALIEAVNAGSGTFEAEVDSTLALDEWLTAGAAQAIIADWDGYFGARNNYKLYHELATDRFILLPWGIDQTFGITDGDPEQPLHHLDYPLDHSGSERETGLLFQRCRRTPSCWERYLDAVEAALAVFEGLALTTKMDTIVTQTAGALSEDRRTQYSDDDTQRSRTALRTFLSERPSRVRAELEDYGR